MTEGDYDHVRANLGGSGLECKPVAGIEPDSSIVHTSAPKTVLDPNREPRFLSLAEAVSIGLEQGTRGSAGLNGQADDQIAPTRGASPRTLGQSGAGDSIRVLALRPAFFGASVEAAASKFDAIWSSSLVWNTTDRPIGTALDAFQAGRAGALNSINTDAATLQTSLLKPLPSGGLAGVTFSTAYQFTNLPARVNPSYQPALQFQLEQPLLQGFGTEINQLRQSHPGSVLSANALPPGSLAPTQEGILVTRIRYDQERADFELSVANMLVNIEVAYWKLYGAYWNMYARELGLRLAYESWRITRAQYYAGLQKAKLQDLARTRGQYELFRGQRLEALGQVLEAERQLRKLIGLPVEDGKRLVPADAPTLAPYQPDWNTALDEALRLRPELVQIRDEVKIKQLAVLEARNRLLPDVRAFATYDINSIGTRLDGPGLENAGRALAENNFNNWQVGIRATIPIGHRLAYSQLRQARLDMYASFVVLRDGEAKARDFLALQYARLFELYERIKARRAEREAYGLQLRLESTRVPEQIVPNDPSFLEAQRFYIDALVREYQAIVEYNNTLSTFEYAKGTLLQHNNVTIGEGQLPGMVAERAVVNEERKCKALVVKERANAISCCTPDDPLGLPKLPTDCAPSLPALFEKAPKMPPAADEEIRNAPLLPQGINPAVPAGATSMKPASTGPSGAASGTMYFDAARPADQNASRVLQTSGKEPSGPPASLPQLP
jgi:outer membrane protein TolC